MDLVFNICMYILAIAALIWMIAMILVISIGLAVTLIRLQYKLSNILAKFTQVIMKRPK